MPVRGFNTRKEATHRLSPYLLGALAFLGFFFSLRCLSLLMAASISENS